MSRYLLTASGIIGSGHPHAETISQGTVAFATLL